MARSDAFLGLGHDNISIICSFLDNHTNFRLFYLYDIPLYFCYTAVYCRDENDFNFYNIYINVKSVHCQCANLSKVPDYINFKNCFSALKELYINYNNITEIPSELTNLEYLDCSMNYIKELPDTLKNLKVLKCFDNQLTSVPETYTSLKEVWAFNNNITGLPKELTKLETLWVSNNKLSDIPETYTCLIELICYNNLIADADGENYTEIYSKRYKSLESLNYTGRPIVFSRNGSEIFVE